MNKWNHSFKNKEVDTKIRQWTVFVVVITVAVEQVFIAAEVDLTFIQKGEVVTLVLEVATVINNEAEVETTILHVDIVEGSLIVANLSALLVAKFVETVENMDTFHLCVVNLVLWWMRSMKKKHIF